MRYARISSQFWNDQKFRKLAMTEKLVYMYLRTCGNANSLGLFWCPTATVASQLDLQETEAEEALRQLVRAKMIHWDPRKSTIYIPNAIQDEVGSIGAGDNRIKHIQRIYSDCLSQRLASLFYVNTGKPIGLTPRKDHTEKPEEEPIPPSVLRQQIAKSLSRYSDQEQAQIKDVFEKIAMARNTKKLTDKKVAEMLNKWEHLEKPQVMYGINVYVTKKHYLDRKADPYLLAIMKNADPEQIRRSFKQVQKVARITERNQSILEEMRRKRNVEGARDPEG